MSKESKQIENFGTLAVGDRLESVADREILRVTALGEDRFLARFADRPGESRETAVPYAALGRGEFARANPLSWNVHRGSLDLTDAAGEPAFLKEFESPPLLQIHAFGDPPVVALDRRLARAVGAALLAWGDGGELSLPGPAAPGDDRVPARDLHPDDRLDLGGDGPVAVDVVGRSADGRGVALRLRGRDERFLLPGSLPVGRVPARGGGDR